MQKIIAVLISSVDGECVVTGTEEIVRNVVLNDVRQRVQNEYEAVGSNEDYYDDPEAWQLVQDIVAGRFDLESMSFADITRMLETRLGWQTGPTGCPSHLIKEL